ncbi:type II toxin-antitoxin system PemK/MazF family toxin [Microbacterium sp. LRZ72]|uniref:type II toxin-antitoxin system PemK/MazF family toxin n=1 Tax=Microbacterium sp. LRZ72 TaxID=2942481 RepID=UPI0029ABD7E5|nr:type II toxin-antitoxin system PemK/MazF family toxin [Microbacterium sp. LRZ72]MDX2377644.1 type II toxin-antitoxin system PemK/MazF family toxin [Microbacterium sp. LRZ72]
MTRPELAPGTVAWASLEPVRGREQGGHRPVLVIASTGYLDAVTSLAIVLPITTVDRGWPNHVVVEGASGLDRPSWVMTEQPRTLSRDRLTRIAGQVSPACFTAVRTWLGDFLDL